MNIAKLNIAFLLLFSMTIYGQKKINTDSLLIQTNKLIRSNANPKLTIDMCNLGIKNAPEYLDFYVNLGRLYTQTKAIDSARYYFNYVLDRNTKYKEVYLYLTNLELSQNNNQVALTKINEAEKLHPDDQEIMFQKVKILSTYNDFKDTKAYINELLQKYPENKFLKQQLIQLRTLEQSDRIGMNYSITSFDRSEIGPWHLTGIQYVHQGNKFSIIGNLNYTNRISNGVSIADGFQFEIESYLKHSNRSYSMAEISSGNGSVFPKFRAGYSFFKSLNEGWEPEIGFRYIRTTRLHIYTGVLGCTKYVGSYWFNLRSFWQYSQETQYNQNKIYPAGQFATRYYFDTRYDFVNAFIGYGSSPDEREILGVFDQRFSLSSFRFGAGCQKLFGNHFIGGIQGTINRQQYNLDNFQNEYTLSLMIQYKF